MKSIVVVDNEGNTYNVPAYLIARMYRTINSQPFAKRTDILARLRNVHRLSSVPNQGMLIAAGMKFFDVEDFTAEDYLKAVNAIYVTGGEYRWKTLEELIPNANDRAWVEKVVASIS